MKGKEFHQNTLGICSKNIISSAYRHHLATLTFTYLLMEGIASDVKWLEDIACSKPVEEREEKRPADE